MYLSVKKGWSANDLSVGVCCLFRKQKYVHRQRPGDTLQRADTAVARNVPTPDFVMVSTFAKILIIAKVRPKGKFSTAQATLRVRPRGYLAGRPLATISSRHNP